MDALTLLLAPGDSLDDVRPAGEQQAQWLEEIRAVAPAQIWESETGAVLFWSEQLKLSVMPPFPLEAIGSTNRHPNRRPSKSVESRTGHCRDAAAAGQLLRWRLPRAATSGRKDGNPVREGTPQRGRNVAASLRSCEGESNSSPVCEGLRSCAAEVGALQGKARAYFSGRRAAHTNGLREGVSVPSTTRAFDFRASSASGGTSKAGVGADAK